MESENGFTDYVILLEPKNSLQWIDRISYTHFDKLNAIDYIVSAWRIQQ